MRKYHYIKRWHIESDQMSYGDSSRLEERYYVYDIPDIIFTVGEASSAVLLKFVVLVM